MSTVLAPATPTAAPRARRVRRGRVAIGLSLLVAGVLCLPLAFLLTEAADSGVSNVAHLIARSLTATLLWNTVRLTVVVTAACAVIGTAAAYGVERTDLPGRHVLAALVVVPFAIPDFVVSFSWSSLSTAVSGYWGAVLVMTLAVYPLVYLPVAASLRGADPQQEEIARSLGVSRLGVFVRVTLAQARRAILGGCLLVALVILAEYGAFEILGYQTFTTEIFTELSVGLNVPAASGLSIVLIGLSLVVLLGEGATRGRAPIARVGAGVRAERARHRLGWTKLPVFGGYLALIGLALGVPVGSACYWMVANQSAGIAGTSLVGAAGYTALYATCAAALATLAAVPLALVTVRWPSRLNRLLERSTFLILAMPGVVVALALVEFSEHDAGGFGYETAPLLILAYSILFFPLALVGVRASVAQAPVRLEEVAASLGLKRAAVLRRVTLRLIAPGLGASFCLVFLSVVTELTATLLLIPTNAETLATQFWSYEQNLSYSQAAPFALAIIAVAAIPSYLLGHYFDRLPGAGGGAPRVVS